MQLRNRRRAHHPREASPADAHTEAERDTERGWIVDPASGRPLPPRAQPGYYPGFSTLAQQAFWDETTRRVVVERVERMPPIRFFSPSEARLMEAVCARLLPQVDRDEMHRIPLVPRIDERLFSGRIDGYRYEDMPADGETYHMALQGIQAIAHHLRDRAFEELEPLDQDRVLKSLHDAQPPAGWEFWQRVPPQRFWYLLLGDVIEVYYSHPWAWDEIGFGGPAYPRGYMRLEGGRPEPWEVEERRYAWEPPPQSLSGEDTPVGGPAGHAGQAAGQEGTH